VGEASCVRLSQQVQALMAADEAEPEAAPAPAADEEKPEDAATA
jgi:hypothetical protein